jgi:hypothetical protein
MEEFLFAPILLHVSHVRDIDVKFLRANRPMGTIGVSTSAISKIDIE